MKHITWLMVAMVALLLSTTAFAYHPVSANASFDDANGLGTFDLTLQDGQNPINKIKLTRVTKVSPAHIPLLAEGPVILLPAGGSTFETYRVGAPGTSIADSLALAGYDVWGLTPRPGLVAEGYCSGNDCSAMATWGMDTYLSDIEIVTIMARASNFGKKAVVGGWSLGGLLGLAATNEQLHRYAGVLLIEGAIYFADPTLQGINQQQCANAAAALANGVLYDDQSLIFQKSAVLLGVFDPTSTSPFDPTLDNATFMYGFTTTSYDPPVGDAPHYTYNAGTYTGWTYADPMREVGVANALFHYDPMALYRDWKCAFGGDRTYSGNLGNYKGKVLSIQAGRAFGTTTEDTLVLLNQATITRVMHQDFGHIDPIATYSYQTSTITPIVTWLDTIY